MTDIRQELLEVQKKLKAPKGQKNNFGDYSYRRAEDILEAVKRVTTQPVTIDQEVVLIGNRYYVKSTATFGVFTMDSISVTAFAREPDEKKAKMDESQTTGSASTYSKKYALQNLFAIDDSEDDPDSKDNSTIEKKPVEKKAPVKKKDILTEEELMSKIRAMKKQETLEGLNKIRAEIKNEYELNDNQKMALGACYKEVAEKIKEKQ
jgi:hypothetical protein